MTCFRPLSGSYISQCKRKTKGENHEQFPSPIGELHFSIDELIPIARDIQCFRPLSGSYISQLLKKKMHKNTPIVSVPYRGATFLNMSTVILKITCVHVSVPYRGATFLNHQNSSVSISLTVSVPYRGATFLNAQRASIQR